MNKGLFPISRFASVIISIPCPGETETQLSPPAAGTTERQEQRGNHDLAEVTYVRAKDFAAALVAAGQIVV
jgi:hypothetical protein